MEYEGRAVTTAYNVVLEFDFIVIYKSPLPGNRVTISNCLISYRLITREVQSIAITNRNH